MPPVPPRLELADNFRSSTRLMWNVLGRTAIRAQNNGGSVQAHNFLSPSQYINVPAVGTPMLVRSGGDLSYNLYRRSTPTGFVPGDLLVENIPNQDDFLNSGKVVTSVSKSEDLTYYYKLTTKEAGVESSLASSPVRIVLSAEETSVEQDIQAAKGLRRFFSLVIPDGTLFNTLYLDLVSELGTYAKGVVLETTAIVSFRLNNRNNSPRLLLPVETIEYEVNDIAAFRIFFENTSGGPAVVSVDTLF